MANKKKYYKILEISTDASQEDIKKSYRELAKKYHPDTIQELDKKTEYEEKFKEISAAYEVLSDPEKRVVYDNSIGEGHNRPNTGPTDLNDFLRQHFKFNFGGNPFGNNPFGHQQHFQQTFSAEQEISYYQMICGGEIEVQNTPAGTIKITLPQGGFPGAQFNIRIKKEANVEIFLQLVMKLKMPKNLTEEQKEKIKELGI